MSWEFLNKIISMVALLRRTCSQWHFCRLSLPRIFATSWCWSGYFCQWKEYSPNKCFWRVIKSSNLISFQFRWDSWAKRFSFLSSDTIPHMNQFGCVAWQVGGNGPWQAWRSPHRSYVSISHARRLLRRCGSACRRLRPFRVQYIRLVGVWKYFSFCRWSSSFHLTT